jgi:hypothetical protein
MKRRRSKIDFDAIGKRWGTCGRTARRWHAILGERIHDPLAIAEMVKRQRNPKTETLKILTETIRE